MISQISSWAELKAFLVSSGRAVRPLEERVLVFALLPGSARSVHARATSFASGSLWVALSAHVCRLPRLRLRAALVANAELPIGGLALVKEDVVLRQTIPLSRLGAAELEQSIRALGATVEALLAALAAAPMADSEQPFAYAFR